MGPGQPAQTQRPVSPRVWDTRTERLILARDRVGIYPLYYPLRHSRFIFASEVKRCSPIRSCLARWIRWGWTRCLVIGRRLHRRPSS
ncbi:hypothetical protein [Propionibacterium sp.]|uniref:hypothetical protein n=1 Tax=Propionibacterium sp. TaxID=1977903 RepID=UPI0039E9EF1E